MSARYMQPLRIGVQFLFLLLSLWLGARLYLFVQHFRSGGMSAPFPHPDGVEAYLPISGLLGVASWLRGEGINPVHPAATVILLTVLLLSFLLRRSFCSWICPVATFSELLWKLGFKLFKRNLRPPAWLDTGLRGIKYLLLVFFIYSIGVTMSAVSRQAFIHSDYHRIADVRLLDFFLHLTPTVGVTVLLLILLSLLVKNPFCRYLCPYGALLGLVAIGSPTRVTRDRERCVSCGMCSQLCPTHIDVMHKTSVASPECIGCWRCVSHCRFNQALSMRFAGRFRYIGFVYATLLLVIFWGGTGIGKAAGHWHTGVTDADYQRLLGK